MRKIHSYFWEYFSEKTRKSNYSCREFYYFVTCKWLNRDCTLAWHCWLWFKTIICQLIFLSVFLYLRSNFYCLKNGHNPWIKDISCSCILELWKWSKWSSRVIFMLYELQEFFFFFYKHGPFISWVTTLNSVRLVEAKGSLLLFVVYPS